MPSAQIVKTETVPVLRDGQDGADGVMGCAISFTPTNLDITVDRSGTFEDNFNKTITIKISQGETVLGITAIAVKSGDTLPDGVTISTIDLDSGTMTMHFAKGGNLGSAETVTAQTMFSISTSDGNKSEIVVNFVKVGKGTSLGRVTAVPTTARVENVTYKNPKGVDTLQTVVYAQNGDFIVLSAADSGYSAGTVFRYNGIGWSQVEDINSCFVAFDDVMSIADNSTASIICKTLVTQTAFINNLITKYVEIKDEGYIKSGCFADSSKKSGFILSSDGSALFRSTDSKNVTRSINIDDGGITLDKAYADRLEVGIGDITDRWDTSTTALVNYGNSKLKGSVLVGGVFSPCDSKGNSLSTDNSEYYALGTSGTYPNVINNLNVPQQLTAKKMTLSSDLTIGGYTVLKGSVNTTAHTLTLY